MINKVECRNGLIVSYGVAEVHGRIKGVFQIAGSSVSTRIVVVSTPELAEKIARLLIDDFNSSAVIDVQAEAGTMLPDQT